MAYQDYTYVTSLLVTANIMNTYIRDNFRAGVPDIFTTAGDLAYATAADVAARLAIGTAGQVLRTNSGATAPEWTDEHVGLTLHMNDGGGVLATGTRDGNVVVPCDCTLIEAGLLADQSGSIVVDIWKDTYANYPPDNADSITSATPLTISAATKIKDTTLTNWTTTFTKGDILRFNIDSCSTITWCDVYMIFKRRA